jgi:hypothetical protein
MSKLIAGTDNEVFECVIGIQVGIEETAVFGTSLMRRPSHELIGRVVEYIFDLERFAEKFDRTFVYQAQIMEGEPIFEIGIGDFDVKTVAFFSDIYSRLEPRLVAIPVYLPFDRVFDKKPRVCVLFVFHVIASDFHRYFHICGKPSGLLSHFCGEGSDIIALPIFKFKENVFFFEFFFRRENVGLEIEADPEFELVISV